MPPPMTAIRDFDAVAANAAGLAIAAAQGEARNLQEVPAAQAQLPAFLLNDLNGTPRPLGLLEVLEETLELPQKGCAGHWLSPSV
jgi:hypothetical protein